MRLLQYATTNYHTRSRKSKWPEVFAKCQVKWAIITAISIFSDWIRVYAGKLVNAPQSHKIEYAPMHTIRVIARLAYKARRTDGPSASSRPCLGYGLTTPHLSLDYALASISYEHYRSSCNNPHYAPRHIIYYYLINVPALKRMLEEHRNVDDILNFIYVNGGG